MDDPSGQHKGLTPEGRATTQLLQFDTAEPVQERQRLMALDLSVVPDYGAI